MFSVTAGVFLPRRRRVIHSLSPWDIGASRRIAPPPVESVGRTVADASLAWALQPLATDVEHFAETRPVTMYA